MTYKWENISKSLLLVIGKMRQNNAFTKKNPISAFTLFNTQCCIQTNFILITLFDPFGIVSLIKQKV